MTQFYPPGGYKINLEMAGIKPWPFTLQARPPYRAQFPLGQAWKGALVSAPSQFLFRFRIKGFQAWFEMDVDTFSEIFILRILFIEHLKNLLASMHILRIRWTCYWSHSLIILQILMRIPRNRYWRWAQKIGSKCSVSRNVILWRVWIRNWRWVTFSH